ncbi:hypothetical protein J2W20_001182 [Sinomonas atrocyanea]|nr:hypothetical protein [Sinomonas atrocyanea]MDR6621302.1 hypothetical protein [Sinomonas atrocyanea]
MHQIAVPQIALNETDPARCKRMAQIPDSAARKIIEDIDKFDPGVKEVIDQSRPNRACASRDQHASTRQNSHGNLTSNVGPGAKLTTSSAGWLESAVGRRCV